MCGIGGIIAYGQDGRAVMALSTALAHRGPDGDGLFGWWKDGRSRLGTSASDIAGADLVLAHRRLAVIDRTPAGNQPMATPDGNGWIVFNGEIYNHKILRAELERDGVCFRSHSDTEVLLQALSHWGEAALDRLDGMYAFAWFDGRTRRLLLARDPFGIKPLYLRADAHSFSFASEIKGLLAAKSPDDGIEPQALWDYLTHGLSDHRPATFFPGIVQLPAGHLCVIDMNRDLLLPQTRPFRLPRLLARSSLSRHDAVSECRKLFVASVDAQRVADVPVGCALSGGTDSSAILGVLRHLTPNAALHAVGYCADDPLLGEPPQAKLGIRLGGQCEGCAQANSPLSEARSASGEQVAVPTSRITTPAAWFAR